jgi:hypothetical protein
VLEAIPSHNAFRVLDRKQLVKLKTKAMRSGAWFRALQSIDRVLIDLTIRVANSVRNVKLVESILTVSRKLESAMESRFSRVVREVGLPLAQKISLTAKMLGNISAGSWVFDSSFAIFLAVMHINNVKIFKR